MFGKFFKDLRDEKQLTLIELSERTGVSKSYLHDIENEKIAPTATRGVQVQTTLQTAIHRYAPQRRFYKTRKRWNKIRATNIQPQVI